VSPSERRGADEPDPVGGWSAELDAAFEDITSEWQDDRPSWPDEEPAADQEYHADDPLDDHDDQDHFQPPEPPPLPRPQPATVGALLLFVLGVVAVAVPAVIGLSAQYGLPLGLLSITAAIAWLAARLRPGLPPDPGDDDGAQV
jgi:hypothetical protein